MWSTAKQPIEDGTKTQLVKNAMHWPTRHLQAMLPLSIGNRADFAQMCVSLCSCFLVRVGSHVGLCPVCIGFSISQHRLFVYVYIYIYRYVLLLHVHNKNWSVYIYIMYIYVHSAICVRKNDIQELVATFSHADISITSRILSGCMETWLKKSLRLLRYHESW